MTISFCFYQSSLGKTNFLTAGFIESCYQKIDIASAVGNPKKVLNLNGQTTFKFGQTGNPSSGVNLITDKIRIQVLDANGIVGDLFNLGGGHSLSDGIFNWVWIGDSIPLIEIKKNIEGADYIVNPNVFTFGNITGTIITTYDQNNTIRESINLEFVNNLEDAFAFSPGNSASCYTFDPFKMEFSTVLDNLCEGVDVKLNIPFGSPASSFFSPNYSVSFNDLFGRYSYFKTTNLTRTMNNGNWCEQCNNIAAEWVPEPVPCGCVDFDLHITLKSCKDCPDLDLILSIPICCSCDIRSSLPQN